MKKFALLLSLLSQVVIGADGISFSKQALDITREKYRLLESLSQNEQAVDIICRVKGRDLKQFIDKCLADIDQLEEQYKVNNICLNDLYNETLAMNSNVEFLRRLVADWDSTEQLLAKTAERINRLFLLGENKEMANIVLKMMGTLPEVLAKDLLLSLSRIAEEFENGMISVQGIKRISAEMIGCVDGIVNHAQKKSLCIQKGEHAKSASRRADIS